MIEILLVFSLNGEPESISDRVFLSMEECKTFVNTLVKNQVVNNDGTFSFFASDGAHFKGKCVEMKEWFLNKDESI